MSSQPSASAGQMSSNSAANRSGAQQGGVGPLQAGTEALLRPQFVSAVRQKLNSAEFKSMSPEKQQKLLALQQQIQRAAALKKQKHHRITVPVRRHQRLIDEYHRHAAQTVHQARHQRWT